MGSPMDAMEIVLWGKETAGGKGCTQEVYGECHSILSLIKNLSLSLSACVRGIHIHVCVWGVNVDNTEENISVLLSTLFP